MGTKVGEFFIDLVVDAATGNLSVKQLTSAIGELEVASLGTAFGIEKVVEKLARLAEASIDAATEFINFTATTGGSWQELQKWQLAAKKFPGASEAMVGTFKSVQKVMTDMRLHGGATMAQLNLPGFQAIERMEQTAKGTRVVYKDFFGIMEEFGKNKTFQGLDKGTQEAMLASFNIPSTFLPIIQEMNKGTWGDQLKQAGKLGLTGEQVAQMGEIHNQIVTLEEMAAKVGTNLLTGGQAFIKTLGLAKDALQAILDLQKKPTTGVEVEEQKAKMRSMRYWAEYMLGAGETAGKGISAAAPAVGGAFAGMAQAITVALAGEIKLLLPGGGQQAVPVSSLTHQVLNDAHVNTGNAPHDVAPRKK